MQNKSRNKILFFICAIVILYFIHGEFSVYVERLKIVPVYGQAPQYVAPQLQDLHNFSLLMVEGKGGRHVIDSDLERAFLPLRPEVVPEAPPPPIEEEKNDVVDELPPPEIPPPPTTRDLLEMFAQGLAVSGIAENGIWRDGEFIGLKKSVGHLADGQAVRLKDISNDLTKIYFGLFDSDEYVVKMFLRVAF